MFLKSLKKITKNINFRLAALFSLIFIVSFLGLFGITYVFLSSSLKREDREILRLELLELNTEYKIGGIERLKREITLKKIFGEKKLSLVRVADRWNNTLFILIPEYWKRADIQNLKEKSPHIDGKVIRFQLSGNKNVLEIVSLRLPDGNLLQTGVGIEDREKTLLRFLEIITLVMMPLILLSFLGGMLLSARLLQPIQNLNSTVQSIIDTGNIAARIPSKETGDELNKLVILFNRMLNKIEMLINGMRNTLDNVAHDLRTPMTRLRGIAEEALQSPKNDELYGEALGSCLEESEHILTMLNTLMDISEAETGILKLNRQRVNLSSVIEDIAELYRYVAEEKNMRVITKVPGELFMFIDIHRIRQVIANLLDNAVKYTPCSGIITITGYENDGYGFIEVEDNGIGIKKDEIHRIWDRLYRGDDSRSLPGLGLGLNLVKAIIQAHAGKIDVSSNPGKGSKFLVSIPVYG